MKKGGGEERVDDFEADWQAFVGQKVMVLVNHRAGALLRLDW
jgi:hypothetical protein